jgi:hypothetical protein
MSYVFTVAIVSGLFYLSSSCVLCVHCCYCLWFVLFFIVLCLMCSLLLLSLVCFIFHRRVSYVFTVAIVSGLFYFSSSCVLCVHCCYCLWFVLFFIVLCLMCSLLLLSLVCFIFHRPVSCVFTVAIVSELFNCDYLYDFFITFMFLFRHFGFIAPKTLNYLTFDFERTWWRLFQKRAVRTLFDIYLFVLKQFIQTFRTFRTGTPAVWSWTMEKVTILQIFRNR